MYIFSDNIMIEKVRSKTKSVLILLAISVILVIVAFISNQWFSKQTIRTIKITNNNVLSNGDINSIIDKQIINVENNGLNLNAIKKTLQSNEYVLNADVWVNSKGVLGINIEERNPIAIFINDKGIPNFIDKYGHIFSYNLHKDFINIPVIRNIETYNNIIKKKDVINIISVLKENYPLLDARISEIKYNKNTKEYNLLMSLGDINVNIGNTNDLENKLYNLQSFIDNVVLTSNDISKYKKLDVRWKNKVIVII